jgi:PAS domain S-box-containing protein
MLSKSKALHPGGHLKQISILITCAVLLIVAVISLQFYSGRQDVRKATAALVSQNIEGSRDDLLTHLGSLVRDYAFWDEAYLNAAVTPNQDWLAENYGPYIEESFGVTAAFMVYSDGRVLRVKNGTLISASANEKQQTAFIGSLRDLAARARNAMNREGQPVAQGTFARFEERISAVSAAIISPADPKTVFDVDALPALIFVQPLTLDWLDTLNKRLHLQHIGLYPANANIHIQSLHSAHDDPGHTTNDFNNISSSSNVSVYLSDVQEVPLARIAAVPPDISPSLTSPAFLGGVALSAVLLVISGLLLRQSSLASQQAAEQNEALRLEVMQREKAERDLLDHKDRLEQTVRERSQSLTRELNRTNALLRDLENALERVQQVVDTANEGYIQVDMDGRVVGCNNYTQRLLGFEARELIGKQVECLITPDSLPLFQEQLRLRNSSPYRSYVVDVITKDRTIIPVEVSATNEIENGILKGSIGFFRDLRAERQQARQLSQARAKTADAQQEKTQFVAHLAQELRGPMNAILGYTQILLTATRNSLPAHQQDQIRRMHQAGEAVLTMVNESVDLVRIESGQVPLNSEPVSANAIVDEALRLAAVLAEQMSVSLVAHHYQPQGRETQVMVRADPGRLRQVLLNLISNGIKYNHPGGEVSITITLEANHMVRFEVRDSGIGIPESQMDALFDPFKRLGQERSHIQGSGLGLAISYRLITAMGGTITANSVADEGSTFAIELPQSQAIGIPSR